MIYLILDSLYGYSLITYKDGNITRIDSRYREVISPKKW